MGSGSRKKILYFGDFGSTRLTTKEQKEAIKRIKSELIKPNSIIWKYNCYAEIRPKFYDDRDIQVLLDMLEENSAEIQQKNTELAEKEKQIKDLKINTIPTQKIIDKVKEYEKN